MKVSSILISSLFLFSGLIYSKAVFAQSRIDVIFLEDGSVINAEILREGEKSMKVLLLTGDTLDLSYSNINKIKEYNWKSKPIDEIVKENRVLEPTRFGSKTGFIMHFTQSSLIGNTSEFYTPFRAFSLGFDLGLGYWIGPYQVSAGALIENTVNGNSVFYLENKLHLSKKLNTPFMFMRGGYSMEFSSTGPSFSPFTAQSDYDYSGFNGLMIGGGIGYRAKVSNHLFLRFSFGYRYLSLTSTETWLDFSTTTYASLHRIKLNLGVSF